MLRKLLLAASAFSMVAAPVAAQAAERRASPVVHKENVAGIGTLGIILSLAIVAGFVAIVASNNQNSPVSP